MAMSMNDSELPQGIVYILTNEAMPGYVKIGRTDGDLAGRVRQLNSTGVPLPFRGLLRGAISRLSVRRAAAPWGLWGSPSPSQS